MSHQPIPHPILVLRASAEFTRIRAMMLEQRHSLSKNIADSRDLLAESSKALARAERALGWWQRT